MTRLAPPAPRPPLYLILDTPMLLNKLEPGNVLRLFSIYCSCGFSSTHIVITVRFLNCMNSILICTFLKCCLLERSVLLLLLQHGKCSHDIGVITHATWWLFNPHIRCWLSGETLYPKCVQWGKRDIMFRSCTFNDTHK